MVSPSSGIESGRGWATPACLVTAAGGFVQIAVKNAGERGCRWKDLRGRIETTPYEEEREMVRNDGESNVVASISEVEHEWLNGPIDSFDHLLDDSLTEKKAEEIKKILERHRGLWNVGITALKLRAGPVCQSTLFGLDQSTFNSKF